ncbi:MAG: sugar phosphate isomerase/epimerase [Kiritimatiellae bacterium]|nr:sugar phosphate isomerase/epimerase [Kiritimatiellia bacterium]
MTRKWSRQVRFTEDTPEALVAGAAAAGLQMLEFRPETSWGITIPETNLVTDPEFVDRLLACSRASGVELAYHAPQGPDWQFGVLPFDTALDRLRICVRQAHALDATYMTLHLGTDEEGSAACIGRGAAVLQAAAPFAEAHGVLLCVENVWAGCSLTDASDFAEFFRQASHPQIRITLDTGHAHIHGCLFDMLDFAGDRLAFTHLHDNPGGNDRHHVPGHGTIDWQRVMRGLNAIGYAGPLNFELREACDFPATTAWLAERARTDPCPVAAGARP